MIKRIQAVNPDAQKVWGKRLTVLQIGLEFKMVNINLDVKHQWYFADGWTSRNRDQMCTDLEGMGLVVKWTDSV